MGGGGVKEESRRSMDPKDFDPKIKHLHPKKMFCLKLLLISR
jgi:hypothetical protein